MNQKHGQARLPYRMAAAVLAAALFVGACAGGGGGGSGPPPVEPPPPPPPPEPVVVETVPGLDALRGRIDAAGGSNGMLTVFDSASFTHGSQMLQILQAENVPDERVEFTGQGIVIADFMHWNRTGTEDVWADLRERTRVAGIPKLVPTSRNGSAEAIGGDDILWVIPAGNTHDDAEGGDRDFWRADHPYWAEHNNPAVWDNAIAAFETGKVLAAGHVRETADGHEPFEVEVACGAAKDWCFRMVVQDAWDTIDITGGSTATMRLSAIGYYLSQLFDGADAIVATLNACAIDIGEPGIDDEYGRGIPSVDCPEVRDAEVREAEESVAAFPAPSALDDLLLAGTDPGFAGFARARGGRTDGTGRAGGTWTGGAVQWTASAGFGPAGLGVASSFVSVRREPFAEVGVRRALAGAGPHRLYAAASYGRENGGMDARVARAGVQYAREGRRAAVSVYAGWREVRAEFGLPGYAFAGAEPVRVRTGGAEVRVAFGARF